MCYFYACGKSAAAIAEHNVSHQAIINAKCATGFFYAVFFGA